MDSGREDPASVGEYISHEQVHVDLVAKAMNLSARKFAFKSFDTL